MSATPELTPTDQAKSSDWREHVGRDEIAELVQMRDGRAWFILAVNWAVVFGAPTT